MRVVQRSWQNERGKGEGMWGSGSRVQEELDIKEIKEPASLLSPDNLAILTKRPPLK